MQGMSAEDSMPILQNKWPTRFTLVGLCFLALIIAYTDRVNISIAAIQMQDDLGWSDATKGLVLSSFFIGYFCCSRSWAAGWRTATVEKSGAWASR